MTVALQRSQPRSNPLGFLTSSPNILSLHPQPQALRGVCVQFGKERIGPIEDMLVLDLKL